MYDPASDPAPVSANAEPFGAMAMAAASAPTLALMVCVEMAVTDASPVVLRLVIPVVLSLLLRPWISARISLLSSLVPNSFRAKEAPIETAPAPDPLPPEPEAAIDCTSVVIVLSSLEFSAIAP